MQRVETLVISGEKTANQHNTLASEISGLPLVTKASLVLKEGSSAALAHHSISFHIHLLSPLPVWCGVRGVMLSVEQGGREIHPHCAERQSTDWDPRKPCHMVLLQFPREICGVLSINSPKRWIFDFYCTYSGNILLALSIM